MILGEERYYPLAQFVTLLSAAARAVVRVGIGDDGLCSGWLIADRLVVLPTYAVRDSGPHYVCWVDDGGAEFPAELVHAASDDGNPRSPALLRLAEPMPDRVLGLHLAQVALGHRLLVVHHPAGVVQARLSLGRVVGLTDGMIRHDAPTEGGSSGAPVLSAETLSVVGMHAGTEVGRVANLAIGLSGLIDSLRATTYWPEIAAHHRLADVAAVTAAPRTAVLVPSGPDPALSVALHWSVDPTALDDATRAAALPLVGDADAPTWSIPGDERRRLFDAAGSVAALRQARPADADDNPGQRTIDRILAGPPFDLDTVLDEELPYWLQAAAWFAGVVPAPPLPAQVNAVLARRRIRGRLAVLVGSRLWGRETELAELNEWYRDETTGPIAVTGIGGVGKSALVARFALDLPPDTVLLWLDFDRPDVAPDDAASVLGALAEDAAAQLDGFDPPDGATGVDGTDLFGAALAAALPPGARPLLVLDGFEIAQHLERNDELWDVLDGVKRHVPAMRVIVSGRAPVEGVTLAGRPVVGRHLTGLPERAARAWLTDRRISDPAVLDAVLRASGGVPLLLKLAVRLIEAGGEITLPAELPRALVDGYLYQRILDRVVDKALQPLARDALVLRRLSVAMLGDVLADRLPPGVDAQAAFTRLTREMAMVELLDPQTASITPGDAAPLRLRPELRAATLRLLEVDGADRVREIDRRAAGWYAAQEPRDDATAVELVYHLLRLGDTAGADAEWRAACLVLRSAVDDIPDAFPEARDWLQSRTSSAAALIIEWERSAVERIRNALRRGKDRTVPMILAERADRSSGSPLVVYDAWVRWAFDGDRAGATAILAEAVLPDGEVGRARLILGALLAAEDGERRRADALLAPYDDPARWTDRPDGEREALTLRAARVRLTVDLQAELDLSREISGKQRASPRHVPGAENLTSGDVLLPALSRALASNLQENLSLRLEVPQNVEELPNFAGKLDVFRGFNAVGELPSALKVGVGELPSPEAWTARELGLPDTPAAELAALARRRWLIATRTLFLCDAATFPTTEPDTLFLATIATLAVFRGQRLTFTVDGRPVDGVDNLLEYGHLDNRFPLSSPRSDTVRTILKQLGSGRDEGWVPLTLYLRGPDPLEVLVRRLLGIPEPSETGAA